MVVPSYIKPTTRRSWWVCDRGVCLYDEVATEKLRGKHPRCIKHGAILTWRWDAQASVPRREVRKALQLNK